MIISRELAQKIVDHLMELVKRNVNIMDCSGIIIASGQPKRIDTLHQGGKQAVVGRHVVEIHPDEMQMYSGALPGVMWPIDLKGQIVGVVGVTGEPHEVRDTANLIKTVTELILEREMFLADYGSENRMKEQFVKRLFEEDQVGENDDINTLAGMLNYRLDMPRLVIVVKLVPQEDKNYASDGLKNLFSDRMRESVSKLIKEAAYFTSEDMSLFYKQKLLILKALPNNVGAEKQKMDVFTSSVLNTVKLIQPRLSIQIGLGSPAMNKTQLRHSYYEALFALEQAGSGMIRSISEFDVLLCYLINSQHIRYSSCLALMELKNNFEKIRVKYDMQRTIRTLLSNNLNISETAEALFIHRNTLKFRLTKLKEYVRLEPCRFFRHAMLCEYLLQVCNDN